MFIDLIVDIQKKVVESNSRSSDDKSRVILVALIRANDIYIYIYIIYKHKQKINNKIYLVIYNIHYKWMIYDR